MQNHVIGNKDKDNKDPKNKQSTHESASSAGKISGNQAHFPLKTQNDANKTPNGPDEKGDAGVKVAAKRAKKIIRKDTSYTDGAIKRAQLMRGM